MNIIILMEVLKGICMKEEDYNKIKLKYNKRRIRQAILLSLLALLMML